MRNSLWKQAWNDARLWRRGRPFCSGVSTKLCKTEKQPKPLLKIQPRLYVRSYELDSIGDGNTD
jgi:hypothetical protein